MDAFIPTNTLACANFDVLKIDGVEDPLINVNRLATLDFEESYFCSAIKFINECNTEITDKKIAFYTALKEATNEVAVLESFSDYFTGVRDIISKFLKFLKSLVDRFIVALNKLIKSDTYITKHIKELDGFKDEDDNFSFYGYNFTFSPLVPDPQAALGFNASLFDDLVPEGGSGALAVTDVKNAIGQMALDAQCDEFRAKVLRKEGRIYNTEFQDELFQVYRDGDTNTVNIDVNSLYIRTASARFKDYDKTKKDVEKQRTEIEKAYLQVQKEVQNVVKSNGNLNMQAFISNLPSGSGVTSIKDVDLDTTGINMSSEMMTQIDTYIKAKVDQIQEYSNIHLMAFSAKLDALKDCYIQDRNVLYTGLNRVIKSGNAKKEVKRK